MKISLIIVIFLILLFKTSFAQQFEGSLNFHGFADNREYSSANRFSQTIFGSRISGRLGLLIDSTHRVAIGTSALQEYGDKHYLTGFSPILYYQYLNKSWNLYLGSFPRQNLIDDYPRSLLNDTLNYYKPNLEGILTRYNTKTLKETFWLDWTGKQTTKDREAFLVGLSGRYQPCNFFISHYGYMLHYALTSDSPEDEHTLDNGALQVQVGYNFVKKTFLDSLTVSAGGMVSTERTRHLSNFKTPKGFIGEIYAGYKRFSLSNTMYIGESHNLLYGDSFYSEKRYNRTDIGWTPILFKNLEAKVTLSFHFIQDAIATQQAFYLKYRIKGSKKVGKGK